jgi:hypothetical protein
MDDEQRREKIRDAHEVWCPTCGAPAGRGCEYDGYMTGTHEARFKEAAKPRPTPVELTRAERAFAVKVAKKIKVAGMKAGGTADGILIAIGSDPTYEEQKKAEHYLLAIKACGGDIGLPEGDDR